MRIDYYCTCGRKLVVKDCYLLYASRSGMQMAQTVELEPRPACLRKARKEKK